jgi:transposase
MTDLVQELLELEDVKVIGYKIQNDAIYIQVESTKLEIPCKKCGKLTKPKGVGKEIQLRHLAVLGKASYITIKPKRGICENCDDHPTTTQSLEWYEPNGRHTKYFEDHLLFSLINSTVSDVSMKENVGYDAVEGVLNRRIDHQINWKKINAIGLLGIDEISLRKGYQDFMTLVTSRYNNKTRILAVIKGREKAVIKEFLLTIPKKLKNTTVGVCTDMYDGYVNAAREVFRNEIPVIVDRFHVAKLYRQCLVNLRKNELVRLRKVLSEETYQSLKPAIAILKRNKEYVTQEEKKILQLLFKYSSALKEAHKLCCQLTVIYNSNIGKRKANAKINAWILLVEQSQSHCFDTFVKTLKKYQTEIVAYFKGRNTSGFVEGFNNKVKVLKRRCYGIFDENSLFRRLFLDCYGYAMFGQARGFAAI